MTSRGPPLIKTEHRRAVLLQRRIIFLTTLIITVFCLESANFLCHD